jgi:hypothetical protein
LFNNIDPNERELLLLAKVRLYKNKLGKKTDLITTLKGTLESDVKIKQTLEQKINELKMKLLEKKEGDNQVPELEENCKAYINC